MSMLGYKVFEPLEEKNISADDEILFYLDKTLKSTNTEIRAICKKTSDGYIVLAGSQISPTSSATADIIKNARMAAKIDDKNILQNDIFFPHPTPASTFVIGKWLGNGWDNWKTKDGLTLNEFLKLEK